MDDQLTNIVNFRDNDILFGRGGSVNHHPGNKFFQLLVKSLRTDYVTAVKVDKPLFAIKAVEYIRKLDPPGRFLKRDESTNLWNDVGDKKAIEKTRQALRENAPLFAMILPQVSGRFDAKTLEDMISNNAQMIIGNDLSDPNENKKQYSTNPSPIQYNYDASLHKTSVCYPSTMYGQQQYATNHLPVSHPYTSDDSLARHIKEIDPKEQYSIQHAQDSMAESSISSIHRVFDPDERKFVDFNFSDHSLFKEFKTPPESSPSRSILSFSADNSFADKSIREKNLTSNAMTPYSEDWMTRNDHSSLIPECTTLNNSDLKAGFYDIFDGEQVDIRKGLLKASVQSDVDMNYAENDWKQKHVAYLKNMQEQLSFYNQDPSVRHNIPRSSIMVHNFVKDLNRLMVDDDEVPEQKSIRQDAIDVDMENLRMSMNSSFSLKNSMHDSISITEIFQDPAHNNQFSSFSSRTSQMMSLILRQSFLSEWADEGNNRDISEEHNKSLYVPDLFFSKRDKRRDVITESSHQLLESVYGKHALEEMDNEEKKKSLQRFLSPSDDIMHSMVEIDYSGIGLNDSSS